MLNWEEKATLKCPYQNLGEVDHDVVVTAVSQLDEMTIQKMATDTPELFYKWCVETYTAQRKAQLELEFQTALLEKLRRCDPQASIQTAA